jgi:hypothetical protein
VNKAADGGITALHMAALNSHTECVQLLLDLAGNVSAVTVQDGTTIDLIGTTWVLLMMLKWVLCQRLENCWKINHNFFEFFIVVEVYVN